MHPVTAPCAVHASMSATTAAGLMRSQHQVMACRSFVWGPCLCLAGGHLQTHHCLSLHLLFTL